MLDEPVVDGREGRLVLASDGAGSLTDVLQIQMCWKLHQDVRILFPTCHDGLQGQEGLDGRQIARRNGHHNWGRHFVMPKPARLDVRPAIDKRVDNVTLQLTGGPLWGDDEHVPVIGAARTEEWAVWWAVDGERQAAVRNICISGTCGAADAQVAADCRVGSLADQLCDLAGTSDGAPNDALQQLPGERTERTDALIRDDVDVIQPHAAGRHSSRRCLRCGRGRLGHLTLGHTTGHSVSGLCLSEAINDN